MRDLAVIIITLGLCGLALRRAWLGVLGLAVVGYLNPHAYASDLVRELPLYQLLFGATLLGVVWARLRHNDALQRPPADWRLALIAVMWLYFLFTTTQAMVPLYAWPRFYEFTKILIPLVLTLVLIDSREKLFCLLTTISGCVSLVTVKGGYWAVMTGFHDRVYGPPGTHFSDNNHFAVLVCMNLALIVLWTRETTNDVLRLILWGAFGLGVVAALSSWSRGGLLTLTVTAVLLIWDSRKRSLALALLPIVAMLTLFSLEASWFDRMATIFNFQGEGSAEGRLDTWGMGIAYALKHPITGAGFEGWRHVAQMDWHSAYVEVAAEHGFVGLVLWLCLLFGTLISLTGLIRNSKSGRCAPWIRDYAAALRTALAAYAVGAAFLGLSYWDIWFHLVIISVLLGHQAWVGNPNQSTPKTRTAVSVRSHR